MTHRITDRELFALHDRKFGRSNIRKRYFARRRVMGPPIRCDNAACHFHSHPLEWNGADFKPVLDHISGNSWDNSWSNLWLLCPNCDSQQPTKGGRNRGRNHRFPDGSYHERLGAGRQNAHLVGKVLTAKVALLPGIAEGNGPRPDSVADPSIERTSK